MKKLSVKAVLNINRLSIPSKINKARLVINAIALNTGVFASPVPDVPTVTTAINNLETAWNDAADGGKSKTAIMHDMEAVLMNMMNRVAHYVEDTADGDENVIHLAALDTKKTSAHVQNEFDVINSGDAGTVIVRRKNIKNASYQWQYSTDPYNKTSWLDAGITQQSKTIISGLTPGSMYWFRVAVVDKKGLHEFNTPISIYAV